MGCLETPPPPVELAPIANLIGTAATLRLIELHGGCRVYVPRKPTERSRFSRELGPEAARALGAAMGGDCLQVPLAHAWLVKVYTLRRESAAQIARRLKMTENTVYVLRRAMRLTSGANSAAGIAS